MKDLLQTWENLDPRSPVMAGAGSSPTFALLDATGVTSYDYGDLSDPNISAHLCDRIGTAAERRGWSCDEWIVDVAPENARYWASVDASGYTRVARGSSPAEALLRAYLDTLKGDTL